MEKNLKKVVSMDNIKLSGDEREVIIIDQTKLPGKLEYIGLSLPEHFYDAIKRLAVRGAPAIGICAAYGMYVCGKGIMVKQRLLDTEDAAFDSGKKAKFLAEFEKLGAYINSSRPTAVNLSHMVDRMVACARNALENENIVSKDFVNILKNEAVSIHKEDMEMCARIAEYGLSLVKNGDGILTHCNAGPLATSRYGTALGPILLGKERGMEFHVFADETRPLLQGARLTSFELSSAGVDVTLICDNMASIVMKSGKVQACFVGCDRVAANGDTANKIGTSGVAILAKYYGIPFYVLGPSSSIDMNCPSGESIVIEERQPDEIKNMFFKTPSAPEDVKCYNPSFDVTDNALIAGIVTEKGIVRPPFKENLAALFSNN